MTGLGVWDPIRHHAWFKILPPPARNIFWAECMAIVAVIDIGLADGAKKIFVFTDSMLCFYLFAARNPNEIVRPIFRYIMQKLIAAGAAVRVRHVPGEQNSIADSLSRGDTSLVARLYNQAPILPLPIDSDYLVSGGIEANLRWSHHNTSQPGPSSPMDPSL